MTISFLSFKTAIVSGSDSGRSARIFLPVLIRAVFSPFKSEIRNDVLSSILITDKLSVVK